MDLQVQEKPTCWNLSLKPILFKKMLSGSMVWPFLKGKLKDSCLTLKIDLTHYYGRFMWKIVQITKILKLVCFLIFFIDKIKEF